MSRYIDADVLIDDLIHNRSFYPAMVASAIKNTPTADVVEVRHGEWLPWFEGSSLVSCSVCGYEFCDLIECGNYCGNCGAKMDGERRANDGT